MSHHHHHHNHECCGNESCSSHEHEHEHDHVCCSHTHHEDQGCDMALSLLDLADQAWMEVLKEKIKEHIRSNDHKIDDLAKLVSEINRERWHHKMAKNQICEDYEKRLHALFSSTSTNTKKR